MTYSHVMAGSGTSKQQPPWQSAESHVNIHSNFVRKAEKTRGDSDALSLWNNMPEEIRSAVTLQ